VTHGWVDPYSKVVIDVWLMESSNTVWFGLHCVWHMTNRGNLWHIDLDWTISLGMTADKCREGIIDWSGLENCTYSLDMWRIERKFD